MPKGEVLIRDRFGVILFKTRTDADGQWELDVVRALYTHPFDTLRLTVWHVDHPQHTATATIPVELTGVHP